MITNLKGIRIECEDQQDARIVREMLHREGMENQIKTEGATYPIWITVDSTGAVGWIECAKVDLNNPESAVAAWIDMPIDHLFRYCRAVRVLAPYFTHRIKKLDSDWHFIGSGYSAHVFSILEVVREYG